MRGTARADDKVRVSTANVFLGRQPIVDRRERVVAYELLYRAGVDSQTADFSDQDKAAAQVVADTFMRLGPDAVLGEALGFFNVTGALLRSDMVQVLPCDRVVVEVLETVRPDGENLLALERLRKQGFRLALDDYVPDDEREELLDLADWVKVDLLATDPKALRGLVRKLRNTRAKLLAEKVSDRTSFERCRKLGFDYFQGFYFARPEVLSGRSLNPGAAALLDLMGRLQAEASTAEVVQALKPHPDLSVGLLRVANSAALAPAQRLARLEDALVYLGRQQLLRWVAVLLFSHDRPGGQRDPLLITAAKRGRLLELVAALLDRNPAWTDRAFLVGILASVEALLGRPLAELVEELRLDTETTAALLRHEGRLGRLLQTALAFERGDFAAVERELADLGLQAADFQAAENAAFEWVHRFLQTLAD